MVEIRNFQDISFGTQHRGRFRPDVQTTTTGQPPRRLVAVPDTCFRTLTDKVVRVVRLKETHEEFLP